MSVIKQIIKLYGLGNLGINKLRYSKNSSEKLRSIGIPLIILLSVGMQLVSFYELIRNLALMLRIPALAHFIFTALGAGAWMIGLTINFFGGSGIVFNGKDLPQWFSLPVKTESILTGRTLILYLWTLAVEVFLFPIFLIQYARIGGLTPLNLVLTIVFILFLPVVPTIIGLLLSLGMNRLFGRRAITQRSKTFQIAFMVVLMVFIFVFIFLMPNELFRQAVFGILKMFARVNWFANLFADVVVYGKISSFLLIVSVSLVAFLIYRWWFGKHFRRIYEDQNAVGIQKRTGVFSFKKSAPFMALFRREITRYFSSGIVVINSIPGLILITLFNVALLFKPEILETLNMIPAGVRPDSLLIPALMITIMIGMTDITAFSISLEGKSFPLLKNYPVPINAIFSAKAALPFSFSLAALLINLPLFAANFSLSTVDLAICFALGISYALFIPLYGLLVNLLFPKFDWENETIVVKQSMASFFGVMGGMMLGFGTDGVMGFTLALANWIDCGFRRILPAVCKRLD